MRLEYAPPPLSRRIVKAVRPLLQPALDHAGDHEWRDVAQRIGNKTAQLWLAINGEEIVGACVTEVTRRRGEKWFNYWLIGGAVASVMAEWEPALSATSLEVGCVGVTLTGRPGWERAINGFERTAVRLERRFS